ncbi:hypothetical protein P5673_012260 [Acropora cervicornis]|uniref:RNA-directed DNA polymerase from transposon BS n=1 Tax=Acropora cervicornis TaxID=6130 RepID=A0AAD9QMM4_ACRCE|nr:hypothetical protein P5673_012260 [Acropora cervicornis]
MKSHIIPTVERCPDQICLHIGTNDLKSKEPNVVADAIVDLAREIENSCDAEIVLSEITTRNDAHSDAVKTVTPRLKQFSRQNRWKLISHANITQNGLHKGGLNREVDVLAINESKLDDSIKNCELYIPGYEIIRIDRNRNGGGVCFYINNSINFVIRHDLNLNDLENLCLEIQKPSSKPFLVVTWYRPPCSSAELFSHYETLVGKLDSLDLEYYLIGHLNCNMASAHFDINTRLLCEISDTNGLQQLIREPTRITESSSSLIDVI